MVPSAIEEYVTLLLQENLNLLYQLSLNNQLYFGISKCFLLGYHLKLSY